MSRSTPRPPAVPTTSGSHSSSSWSSSAEAFQASTLADATATAATTTSMAEGRPSGRWRTQKAPRPHHSSAAADQLRTASSKSRPLSSATDPERDQQAERELPRTPPPRTEIEGDDDQRDAEWDGQSVEHRHDLHGLEPEQEVVPPRDVRRQRRGEVERGRRRRPRRPPGRASRRAGRGDMKGSRCRVWARACGTPRPRVPHTEDFSGQGAPSTTDGAPPGGGRIGGGRKSVPAGGRGRSHRGRRPAPTNIVHNRGCAPPRTGRTGYRAPSRSSPPPRRRMPRGPRLRS